MNHTQNTDANTKLEFPSTPLMEEIGVVGIAILVTMVLFGAALCGLVVLNTGSARGLLALLAIVLVSTLFTGIAVRTSRGKVVLEADGIVERNDLNVTRRFGYEQIFDLKNGVFANTLVIYYYPYLKNGTLDTRHPRRTDLITVKDIVGLKTALARRVTAPRVHSPAPFARLAVLTLLVFVLVLIPILLFLGWNLFQ